MVLSRKRGRQEMEAAEPPAHKSPTMLSRIRNMWEFANLMQWVFIFGAAVKLDDKLDIEDLEMECLKPQSTLLSDIGLALLKFVSSHRGLTPEIFDEYTRRQYVSKAPHINPFGIEEEPAKFNEFDVFTKIRVLRQLTQWTMINPDRIRERMEEQKDSEQTIWRIEPFGWDSEDRTYIVLDDNRLYRRTDPPLAPAPLKKNTKKAKAARRASKRIKLSIAEAESDAEALDDEGNPKENNGDTFGGMKWECLAITLEEINDFIASIAKSRDPNEKVLRKRISNELVPILEKQEESRKRKAIQKERELFNLERLATAKRSSRIAGKAELHRMEEESREAERKRQADLIMAKKEQEKWQRLEKERETRMLTREQRVKEREARRILHEEELANLSEDSKKLMSGEGRLSERHLKAEIEKKKQALEELADDDEDWIFDCICGDYGQVDDGTHSIACEKCNIWQHSRCVGVSQEEAERDDFHFICKTCVRRAEDAERAKTHPTIKIRFSQNGSSNSSTPPKATQPKMGTFQTVKSSSPLAVPSPQKFNSYEISSSSNNAARSDIFNPQRPSVATKVEIATELPPSNHQSITQPNSTFRASDERGPQLSHGMIPPSMGTLSSPSSRSPVSLPPPAPLGPSSNANGHGSHYHGPSKSQNVQPYSEQPAQHAALPGSPSKTPSNNLPTSSRLPMASSSPAGNSQFQSPAHVGNHRRSSITMPSPLNGSLLLTPLNRTEVPRHSPVSETRGLGYTPITNANMMNTPHQTTPVTREIYSENGLDSAHSSVLPPAATGLSPKKHSPPPRVSLNGSFTPATPSVLPPVASLSPSPRLENLTPPVKSSEPDRARQNRQSVVLLDGQP